MTVERLFAPHEGAYVLNEAKAFLTELLAEEAVAAKEGFRGATARGISTATLNRAKSELHIVTYRAGELGKKGGGAWFWKLPEDA